MHSVHAVLSFLITLSAIARIQSPQRRVHAGHRSMASPFMTGPLAPAGDLESDSCLLGNPSRFDLPGKCSRISILFAPPICDSWAGNRDRASRIRKVRNIDQKPRSALALSERATNANAVLIVE